MALLLTGCGEPVTGVCDKQVRNYVEQKLGAGPVSISWVWEDRAGRSRASAWVTTDTCQGQYVVRLSASEKECEATHYGPLPDYIVSVRATGDCALP